MHRLVYHRKRVRDLGAALGAARAVAERERWPRERLVRYQQERLEALVRDLRERSPYWAARLPRGRVALERLPRMDKVELTESFDELVTDRRLRRDELLAHLERIDRDEGLPRRVPGDGDQRLVGAQGGVRLRPPGLEGNPRPVPAQLGVDRAQAGRAAYADRLGRGRRPYAHDAAGGGERRGGHPPCDAAGGDHAAAALGRAAQRGPARRPQRLPVDGPPARRRAARRPAAVAAAHDVDEQRAAHRSDARGTGARVRRAAVQPLRDDRCLSAKRGRGCS